jgi:CHASE2 domain-containing sensor protein
MQLSQKLSAINFNQFKVPGLVGFLITGVLWPLCFLFYPLLNPIENMFYDLQLQWRGTSHISKNLVLVGWDAQATAQFGESDQNRKVMGQLIRALGKAKASVIAPSFYFGGYSPIEFGGEESDQSIIQATGMANNVVYPIPVIKGPSHQKENILRLDPAWDKIFNSFSADIKDFSPSEQVFKMFTPLTPLIQKAQGIGYSQIPYCSNGTYRSFSNFVQVKNYVLPAFEWEIVSQFLKENPKTPLLSKTLNANKTLVNYAGSWADAPFLYMSVKEAWAKIKEKKLTELNKFVQGKIVLLFDATGKEGFCNTPLEEEVPPGFVQANVIHTLLTGNYLWKVPYAWSMLPAFLLSSVGTWLLLQFPGWRNAVYMGGIAIGYFILLYLMFFFAGWAMPILPPLLAVGILYGGRWLLQRRKKLKSQQGLENQIQTIANQLAGTRATIRRHQSKIKELEAQLDSAKNQNLHVDPRCETDGWQSTMIKTEENLLKEKQQLDSSLQERQALEKKLSAMNSQPVTSSCK